MPLEVDDEALVTGRLFGGPRLELREVDGPRRELLEDGEQRTGSVSALEHDDRRLVVTGGRRQRTPADQHEAGLVLGVVLDVGREHVRSEERRVGKEGVRTGRYWG